MYIVTILMSLSENKLKENKSTILFYFSLHYWWSLPIGQTASRLTTVCKYTLVILIEKYRSRQDN